MPADQRSIFNVARNTAPWTEEEDKSIISLHQALGGDWEEIKKQLPRRPSCKAYFRHNYPDLFYSKQKPNYNWTPNEDRVLTALEMRGIPLGEWPSYFSDRHYQSCINRRHQPRKSGHMIAQRPWSEQEEQRLVELHKANKSWVEIWKALDGAHTHVDCRTHWFDKFWGEFNNSIVNGEIDLEKLKEGRRNGGTEELEANEVDDGEANANRDMDYEEEYGDADADGDTDYEEEWSGGMAEPLSLQK